MYNKHKFLATDKQQGHSNYYSKPEDKRLNWNIKSDSPERRRRAVNEFVPYLTGYLTLTHIVFQPLLRNNNHLTNYYQPR